MILSFIKKIEETISSSPIVISSNIQKHFSPSKKEAYIKGLLLFLDFSSLEFSFYVSEKRKVVIFEKYRYQYMNSSKDLVFRYDNAPHHKEIATFPRHKHLKDNVVESPLPDIKDLLDEIGALIIQAM